MNPLHPKAESIAQGYIGTSDALKELGWGVEGVVFSTPTMTAVKVHSRFGGYQRELAVYQRLRDNDVVDIQGFAVPRLIQYDEPLQVIEMSIVKRPWLLDFSQTALDREPDFPEGIDEWWDRVRERFDPEQFEIVESVFWELQNSHGIYYWDLKPGNFEFA